MNKRLTKRMIVPVWVALLSLGCAGPSPLHDESTGEKIRKVVAYIDQLCKERGEGPYLDSADPEYSKKNRSSQCDILKVKPFNLRAVLATSEGKFVYSIQLPPPLDRSRVRKKDYVHPASYFDALCLGEAGDYIFKTLPAVEGVRVFRTPKKAVYDLGPLSEESPLPGGPAPEEALLASRYPYKFAERPLRDDERHQFPGAQYLRFVRDLGIKPSSTNLLSLRSEPIREPDARYGYLWRATEEQNDRENGIVGGDLIVMDFATQEILAVRRSFARYEVDERTRDSLMLWPHPCGNHNVERSVDFVKKVLQPKDLH